MIPGVFTATELMNALALGVEIVKVFPAGAVGSGYLRALRRDPFPGVQILATGGISAESAPEYLAAGAVAVGLGRELVGNTCDGIDPRAIENRARALVESVST